MNGVSHLNLENILQSMGDAFVSLDKDWRYVFINDKALALMAKPKEELIGNTLWNAFPDIAGTVFDTEYRRVMNEKVNVSFETYYPSYDMWLEVRSYPHADGIVIFYTDITRRKKSEQEALEVGQRFQLFAKVNPAGVFHTDGNGRCLFVNNRWVEITGASLADVQNGSWCDVVHEDECDESKEYWEHILQTWGEINKEYRFRHKHTGKVMNIWMSARPIIMEDGSLRGYVGTIEDITERKLGQRTIEEINRDLEEKVRERTLELTAMLEREKELNDLKSRFVSIASHEFRTPLSTILSSAELIENYRVKAEPEKQGKHIERIRTSVENLINTLGVFLSLEKLETGKVKLEVDEFDIEDFIRGIAEEFENIIKNEQSIAYEHQGNKLIVSDKRIVRNILLNLISNASKYSARDVTVTSSVDNDKLNITIKDEGIGIPEEEQKHLFSKFFRAGNVGNVQGTGLGLNIVKRYVELLKGSISFTSVKGQGTTFSLEFGTVIPE